MSTTIIDADRARAEDFGTTAQLEADARVARAAHDAAWAAFEAYVARGDHDTQSEEYARVRGAYLAARDAKDAAERACCAAMP